MSAGDDTTAPAPERCDASGAGPRDPIGRGKAGVFAAASGLLSAAAFPPAGLWFLALAGSAPLFYALLRSAGEASVWRRVRRGFLYGWISGAVFFGATLWWIGHVTAPGTFLLCCYLALYPAVTAAAIAWILRPVNRDGGFGAGFAAAGPALLAGGLTSGLEWVRSFALSGFEWNGPAVPLIDSVFRAPASAVGVHGLAVLPVATSFVAAAAAFRTGRARAGAAAALALLLTAAGGLSLWCDARWRERESAASAATALLVQPNVPMDVKMSDAEADVRRRWQDLVSLTEQAVAAHPDAELVVWPESAIPWFFHAALDAGLFDRILGNRRFTLVTGADAELWGLQNCLAALRGSPANHVVHGKVRLVPFGEFIPFRRELPFLEKMLGDLIPVDFDPGTWIEPVQPDGQPFGIVPLICFEDTIGGHTRRFIRPGPQVMVNITNDNWFHESPGVAMHFLNARWRAVETRRPLLRSANTGFTAAVRPDGSVATALPPFTAGVLAAEFPLREGDITLFAARGDWFSRLAGGLAAAGIAVMGILRSRRDRRTAPDSPSTPRA